MNTEIIKLDETQMDAEIIQKAGTLIRQGGLVAFPTETVYGLGADALQSQAAMKIYEAKGRPSDNPLIVHIARQEAIEKIVTKFTPQAKLLAETFWPGPLTMILPKAQCVPYETTGGLETVAVRMPKQAVALALIDAAGGYVAAPSANLSGRPSPTKAEHVIEDLAGRIDMILDAGVVGIGLESTIIDLSEEVPVILRPGAITQKMLSKVIGETRLDPALVSDKETDRPKAPGMKYRHYAPKAPLIVVEGSQRAVIEKINSLAQKKKTGIICTDETKKHYTHGIVKSIGSRQDEDSIARNLYGILREFDNLEVECIYSEAFDTPNMGLAIMNRLLKAAGHQKMKA